MIIVLILHNTLGLYTEFAHVSGLLGQFKDVDGLGGLLAFIVTLIAQHI